MLRTRSPIKDGYSTQLTLKLLLLWSHNAISDSHGSAKMSTAMQSSVQAHLESY